MPIIYLTLVALSCHWACSTANWVDPHDMNIKHSHFTSQTSTGSPDSQQCDCPPVISFSISHYKRLLNFILISAGHLGSDGYRGHLHINLPQESYDFLKSFASDTQDVEDAALLRKVDQILSRSLVKPRFHRLGEALTSWADQIYHFFHSRAVWVYVGCAFLALVTYKLLKANFTIWAVVKYLVFMGWLVDFAFTWMNLLQEAEINKMADSLMYESMPMHCNPNKMNILQYMWSALTSNSECRRYHQVLLKDNFWSIAPVTVLSHQFGVLVQTPAAQLGQAIGALTAGILSSLPWGVNVVLLPVLLIFFALIICISLSFACQTSFKICLFHMFQMEFGNSEWRQLSSILGNHNATARLGLTHRNMVEDVRPAESQQIEPSISSNLPVPSSGPVQSGDNLVIESSCENVNRNAPESSALEDNKAINEEQEQNTSACVLYSDTDDKRIKKGSESVHLGSGDNCYI